MKLVTWNCNGAFRKKFSDLEKRMPADIYVIQECEDPEQSKDLNYKSWKGFVWVGNNRNKGLGIFFDRNIKVQKLHWESQDYKYFLPVRINDQFDMIGCWCHKGVTGTHKYIGQLWHYLNINSNNIDKLIVVGDFNANKIWDKKSRNWNFTNVVEIFNSHKICSLYHTHNNIDFGVEKHPTLYFTKKKEKPYHIDYCFVSESLIEEIKMVNIGIYNDWIGLSDHMPVSSRFELKKNEKNKMDNLDLNQLIAKILKFRDDRDWEQFHNPKDLALALSIEASELLELYLWKTDEKDINSVSKDKIKEELADIFMYSFLLLNKMDLNLQQIIEDKIKMNNQKYPVSKSKGNSTKYNHLK